MNIDNSINISNQVAASISKLNLSSGKRTLQNNKQEEQILEEENIKNEQKNLPEFRGRKIDVEDIQKYALSVGENITTDDINYALMYGRSVIADYSI